MWLRYLERLGLKSGWGIPLPSRIVRDGVLSMLSTTNQFLRPVAPLSVSILLEITIDKVPSYAQDQIFSYQTYPIQYVWIGRFDSIPKLSFWAICPTRGSMSASPMQRHKGCKLVTQTAWCSKSYSTMAPDDATWLSVRFLGLKDQDNRSSSPCNQPLKTADQLFDYAQRPQ